MDLVCTRCGEPWELDTVLHDEPEGFERKGGLIRTCPCCRDRPVPPMSPSKRAWLKAVAAVAPLFGDDLDGLAACLAGGGME
jgi:hypothetical protein